MAMGRRGRAVIPLLGAFTAVAIVVAGVAVTLQMQERNLRLAKERELVLAKAENDDLQQRLEPYGSEPAVREFGARLEIQAA